MKWMSKLYAKSSRQVEIIEETMPDIGETKEFKATVTRESFQKELARSKALDAFYELIRKLIDVLEAYHLKADSLVTTSPIVELDELRLFIPASLRSLASDTRVKAQLEPGFVAAGALLLQDLIQKQSIAVDPAFYGSIFWPSAELRAANDAAWKISGVMKLSHTKTDVPAVTELPAEALVTMSVTAPAQPRRTPPTFLSVKGSRRMKNASIMAKMGIDVVTMLELTGEVMLRPMV